MLKLQGQDIYLATLERRDCKRLWNDFEFDFDHPYEPFNIGHSEEKADAWFDEIQKLQGERHVRLGIFMNDGTLIGDVALQDIDRTNRCASLGMGMAKLANRGKGYGQQAVRLMLNYGFHFLGLERITANTLEINIGAQRCLEKAGLTLEGTERRAVYLNGHKVNRLNYAILVEEFRPAGDAS